jgi:hypothetical protein
VHSAEDKENLQTSASRSQSYREDFNKTFESAMEAHPRRYTTRCFQGLDGILFALFHPVQVKHERLASARERQNAVQCATHNALPPELILQIASTLSNADFLSPRFSCRWFAALLQKDTAKRNIGKKEWEILARKLKFDVFVEQATAEILRSSKSLLSRIPWRRVPDEILCCACLIAHSLTAFTFEETQRPPTVRKCIGSNGVFQACEPQLYDFAQLSAMLSDVTLRPNSGTLSLCHAPIVDNLPNFTCLHRVHTGELMCLSAKHFWIRHGENPLRFSIAQSLSELDVYVCPHMHTSHLSLHRRLEIDLFNSVSELVASVGCENKNCDTILRFCVGEDMGLISIDRNLGDLTSATNPKWLAQLEGC